MKPSVTKALRGGYQRAQFEVQCMISKQKESAEILANSLKSFWPEVGFEPTQSQTPRDFESKPQLFFNLLKSKNYLKFQ